MSSLLYRSLTNSLVLTVATARFTPAVTSVRDIAKHWNPRFKKERRQKVLRVNLPDFDEMRPKKTPLTPPEAREKMKKEGVSPGRQWNEKPMFLSSTGAIVDPYVPPEGDGKMTLISKEGAVQRMEQLTKKGRSMLSLRKIRQYDEDFALPEFCEHALDIYKRAHEALAANDEDTMHDLVTERCFLDMKASTELKSIRWSFIASLEPARVVHLRTTELINKENQFAQATVRFHTQQTLAIYDRFGRLLHGSPSIVKDVVEYAVFEKHLSNLYGTWRLHGKLMGGASSQREPVRKTYVYRPPEEEQETTPEVVSKAKTETAESNTSGGPTLATA